MIEQPTFEPLALLVGSIHHPRLLSEAWSFKTSGDESIRVAGLHSGIQLGNEFAIQEAWAIAGKALYESREETDNHKCLHRGVHSATPKRHLTVGIPKCGGKFELWMKHQTAISQDCVRLVQNLATATPDWLSQCRVSMKWETPAKGSAREKKSAV